MESRVVKRLLLLVLSMSFCLAPAAAQAAISASLSGGVLTVSSNDSGNVDETYTLRDVGGDVGVTTSPALAADPDGLGSDCYLDAGEARCDLGAVDRVRVVAGNGTDTIVDHRATGPSTLEGGPGDDTITTTTAGTQAELLGQAGADHLTAADADDVLTGGDDGDTLTAVGEKGFSALDSGGAGNDTFVGNDDAADLLVAEAGADTYALGTCAGGDQTSCEDEVAYDGVAGPVAVRLDGVADDGRAGEQDDVRADVERVDGTTAGDLLQAGPHAVTFAGGDGDDQLLGGPGADRLFGGSGSDVLRGGDGDDTLNDGDFTATSTDVPLPPAGNDVLDGGGGADDLETDRGADDVSGGPGVDRTMFSRPIPQAPSVPTPAVPAGFTVSLDDVADDGQTGTAEGDNVHSDVEQVRTTGGDDVITGTAGADDVDTGAGNDVVDPGAGPDVVDLGPGDDRVSAVDQTSDVLRCGAGADTATVDLPGGQPTRADALFDCENVTGTPLPFLPTPPSVYFPPAPPPAVDTTRPVLTLSSKTIKSKSFLATGRLSLTIKCNEACSARAEAFATLGRSTSVGKASLKLGTGRRTLRITIAKKQRSKLRAKLHTKAQRKHGLTFRVVVTVRDAAGNATKSTRRVVVKG